MCGHLCSFFPYMKRTKPIPPGMSDRKIHVGSKFIVLYDDTRMKLASLIVVLFVPVSVFAQQLEPRIDQPMTAEERIHWVVDGTVGLKSLTVVGPIGVAWQTAWNQPEEWGQGWSGVGKRYLQREADVA